jgi:hypothetical protein
LEVRESSAHDVRSSVNVRISLDAGKEDMERLKLIMHKKRRFETTKGTLFAPQINHGSGGGRLNVRIVRAFDLTRQDGPLPAQNLAVALSLDSEKLQTSNRFGKMGHWNEELSFRIVDGVRVVELAASVMSIDQQGVEELVGTAFVPIALQWKYGAPQIYDLSSDPPGANDGVKLSGKIELGYEILAPGGHSQSQQQRQQHSSQQQGRANSQERTSADKSEADTRLHVAVLGSQRITSHSTGFFGGKGTFEPPAVEISLGPHRQRLALDKGSQEARDLSWNKSVIFKVAQLDHHAIVRVLKPNDDLLGQCKVAFLPSFLPPFLSYNSLHSFLKWPSFLRIMSFLPSFPKCPSFLPS